MENQKDEQEPNGTQKPTSESANETAVHLEVEGLSPYVKVVRPTRPALTYDRME